MIYSFLFVLGFISLGFQIILLREFLTIFSDNELIIGIFLASWMVTTGAGSYIAGIFINRLKNLNKSFCFLVFLTGLIMPVEIFFLRFVRQFLQKTPTEMLGLIPILFFSFAAVSFICFLFGVWFVFAAKMYLEIRKTEENAAGRLYAFESFGAVFGGMVVSIFFIRYFNVVQISLFFSFLVFGILAIFFSPKGSIQTKKYYVFLILTILFLLKSEAIEKYSLAYNWRPFNVVDSKDSVYGRVTVLKNENEYDFYENSNKIYSTVLLSKNEEIIHIPLLLPADKRPQNILMIGGGGKSIYEALKYPVKKITYIEPNSVFLEFLQKYSNEKIKNALNSPKVKIIRTDGRVFVKKTEEKFDCVIVDVPPPVTGLANRYFTYEFFNEIKNVLSWKGIVIFPLLSSENYMSSELKLLSASIYNTAGKVFKYRYIIPASNNYFICSQRKLDINPNILTRKIKKEKIETEYLTSYYLKYILRTDRVERVVKWITEKKDIVSVNKDFYPVCYLYGLNYWVSYFGKTLPEKLLLSTARYKIAMVLILIYVISIVFFVKLKKFGLQTIIIVVSSASIVLELSIIFAFQSIYGYIYYKIGILLSLCLLGVGLGSFISDRTLVKKENIITIIKTVMFCMVLFACLLPFLFKLSTGNPYFMESIFYILISAAGFFIGVTFPLVVKKHSDIQETKIGKFYSFDLAGAMLGSVSASLIFIPLFGIINTCFLTAFFLFLLIFFI